MQPDIMEKLEGSLIQHGPENDRIYLMKFKGGDSGRVIKALDCLAEEKSYSKIFAKIPGKYSRDFLDNGYKSEAEVPGFFEGKDDAMFFAKYFSQQRAVADNAEELDSVLEKALAKSGEGITKELEEGFIIRRCVEKDAKDMSEIYKVVFPSYPFPIDNPDYIVQTMASHVIYFGVEYKGELIALSSAETDMGAGNAEMTDFATLPDWRGRGFAVFLLAEMEEVARKLGIITAYTIARAVSPGMNITFSKLGYKYGGRLVNNTNISGNIESMNVWYKSLL